MGEHSNSSQFPSHIEKHCCGLFGTHKYLALPHQSIPVHGFCDMNWSRWPRPPSCTTRDKHKWHPAFSVPANTEREKTLDKAFQHPKYKTTLSTQPSFTGTSARLSISPCARPSGPHPRRFCLSMVSIPHCNSTLNEHLSMRPEEKGSCFPSDTQSVGIFCRYFLRLPADTVEREAGVPASPGFPMFLSWSRALLSLSYSPVPVSSSAQAKPSFTPCAGRASPIPEGHSS